MSELAQKIVESIVQGKSADAVDNINVALSERAQSHVKETLAIVAEQYKLKRINEEDDEDEEDDGDESEKDEGDEDSEDEDDKKE